MVDTIAAITTSGQYLNLTISEKMGTTEKFCLRWNDFERNISGALKEIREDKDFFDVTLACDDDQIQAHKVILSACSPFFRSILRRNRHEHPLLYLKGVKFSDLVSVLTFMYQGEVNVAQDELNTFLAVSEDLKVKGLTQNSSDRNSSIQSRHENASKPCTKESSSFLPPSSAANKQFYTPTGSTAIEVNDVNDVQEVIPVKLEAPCNTYSAVIEEENTLVSVPEENMLYPVYGELEDMQGEYLVSGVVEGDELRDLDAMIAQSMSQVVDEAGTRLWTCNLCNRTNKDKTDIRRHMEKHFKAKHNCPQCDKQASSREALRVHIYRHHR